MVQTTRGKRENICCMIYNEGKLILWVDWLHQSSYSTVLYCTSCRIPQERTFHKEQRWSKTLWNMKKVPQWLMNGPFRNVSILRFDSMTGEETVRHPLSCPVCTCSVQPHGGRMSPKTSFVITYSADVPKLKINVELFECGQISAVPLMI